jgi:hypothetical protein
VLLELEPELLSEVPDEDEPDEPDDVELSEVELVVPLSDDVLDEELDFEPRLSVL